jgi:hypothetical protein
MLCNMPSLYELELEGSNITDKTLTSLCSCSRLVEINLNRSNSITYEGARLLKDKLHPSRFSVSGCEGIPMERQGELFVHEASR